MEIGIFEICLFTVIIICVYTLVDILAIPYLKELLGKRSEKEEED
jgi:hypothetical protein